MLALLAALLLSTARAATPEAGVQEDASIAIETPAKVVRHFDGSLRIGYADPLDLGQGSSFMESLAARLEAVSYTHLERRRCGCRRADGFGS